MSKIYDKIVKKRGFRELPYQKDFLTNPIYENPKNYGDFYLILNCYIISNHYYSDYFNLLVVKLKEFFNFLISC